MKLKLPKIFAERLEIQQHLRKVSLIDRIIYFWIDRRYSKSTELSSWANKQLKNPIIKQIVDSQLESSKYMNNKERVRNVVNFINSTITYKRDKDVWKVDDMWQSVDETWNLKTGDCEDGAILIYCLLRELGVPEVQLTIACGDVVGGGHAYVLWLSDEDGLEYPIDWCYWFTQSEKLRIPYVQRSEYHYGLKEWFRFNSSGGYVKR